MATLVLILLGIVLLSIACVICGGITAVLTVVNLPAILIMIGVVLIIKALFFRKKKNKK